MLAYVFWHRPGDGVDPAEYERACARSTLSSTARRPPSVSNSSHLGRVGATRTGTWPRPSHDRVAAGVTRGWGGIYELLRGEVKIPIGTEWFDKPLGEPSEEFLASRPENTIWRRQMVLGPAPEFCAATQATPARIAI